MYVRFYFVLVIVINSWQYISFVESCGLRCLNLARSNESLGAPTPMWSQSEFVRHRLFIVWLGCYAFYSCSHLYAAVKRRLVVLIAKTRLPQYAFGPPGHSLPSKVVKMTLPPEQNVSFFSARTFFSLDYLVIYFVLLFYAQPWFRSDDAMIKSRAREPRRRWGAYQKRILEEAQYEKKMKEMLRQNKAALSSLSANVLPVGMSSSAELHSFCVLQERISETSRSR